MALLQCRGCKSTVPEGGHFCPSCGVAQGAVERPRQAQESGGGWIDFLDRSWDFFASTKTAWILIAVLAVASVAGSLIEQESHYQDWRPPALYYPDRYGEFLGNLYLKLGLTHAYSSVWYAALVLLCVISLIICSFHRLIPLHRMLTTPQVWKLPHFFRRQEVFHEMEGDLQSMEPKLKKLGYNLRRDRECLYGDKGRLSRYGPYIIHIGLLVVAFAGFAKAIPGWDLYEDVWLADGQTSRVPGVEFALTNHKFTLEFYENGAPKRFATDLSILENGHEVARDVIEVNHPMSYQGWEIYQVSWLEEPGVAHVTVKSAVTKQPVTDLKLDLRYPEPEYQISDSVKMVVRSYYQNFTQDPVTGEATNASYEVNNPVFLVEFVNTATGEPVGRVGLPVLAKTDPVFEGPFYMEVTRVDTRYKTALKLHKDLTVPYLYVGLGIVMLGMAITFFLFHYQVWVREENGKLLIGGRAYKNKFGLKRELGRLAGASDEEAFDA